MQQLFDHMEVWRLKQRCQILKLLLLSLCFSPQTVEWWIGLRDPFKIHSCVCTINGKLVFKLGLNSTKCIIMSFVIYRVGAHHPSLWNCFYSCIPATVSEQIVKGLVLRGSPLPCIPAPLRDSGPIRFTAVTYGCFTTDPKLRNGQDYGLQVLPLVFFGHPNWTKKNMRNRNAPSATASPGLVDLTRTLKAGADTTVPRSSRRPSALVGKLLKTFILTCCVFGLG